MPETGQPGVALGADRVGKLPAPSRPQDVVGWLQSPDVIHVLIYQLEPLGSRRGSALPGWGVLGPGWNPAFSTASCLRVTAFERASAVTSEGIAGAGSVEVNGGVVAGARQTARVPVLPLTNRVPGQVALSLCASVSTFPKWGS